MTPNESQERNANLQEKQDSDELNVSILQQEFGRGNVGILGTAFNLFKCFIGIGILGLPATFESVPFFDFY